jgi:hypothetical protein
LPGSALGAVEAVSAGPGFWKERVCGLVDYLKLFQEVAMGCFLENQVHEFVYRFQEELLPQRF